MIFLSQCKCFDLHVENVDMLEPCWDTKYLALQFPSLQENTWTLSMLYDECTCFCHYYCTFTNRHAFMISLMGSEHSVNPETVRGTTSPSFHYWSWRYEHLSQMQDVTPLMWKQRNHLCTTITWKWSLVTNQSCLLTTFITYCLISVT